MKYIIEAEELPENTIKQNKFDKNGNPTHSKEYYAESTEGKNGLNYFIKTFSSLIYDPYGPYSKRESTLDLKLKKVSLKTFNNYIEYLKTKNLKYLTIAQRGFIDDRA